MKNFTTLCLKVLFNSWLTFLIIAEAEVKKKKQGCCTSAVCGLLEEDKL
jgi:hypothetical protein